MTLMSDSPLVEAGTGKTWPWLYLYAHTIRRNAFLGATSAAIGAVASDILWEDNTLAAALCPVSVSPASPCPSLYVAVQSCSSRRVPPGVYLSQRSPWTPAGGPVCLPHLAIYAASCL
jgi:hypothetical protein